MSQQHDVAALRPPTPWFYRLLRVLAGLALVAGVAGLVCQCLQQTFIDTFYMVASGEWMLEHSSVQRMGISSPIPMATTLQNWLFCVFAALCLRASEALGLAWYGMSAVTALMTLACVAVAVAVARSLTKGSRTAQLATALLFLAIPSFADFRPHALVVALTIATLWANVRWAMEGEPRALLFVAPITALHANVQAATVLTQPLVCLGYAAALAARPAPGASRRLAVVPALVALASLAACFVTPYGAAAALYGVSNARLVGSFGVVMEMLSIAEALSRGDVVKVAIAALAGGALAGVLACQRRATTPRPLEAAMALAAFVASLAAIRNLLYAALLTWWLAMVSWDDIRRSALGLARAHSLADALSLSAGKARAAAGYLAFALLVAFILSGSMHVVTLAEHSYTARQRACGILNTDSAPIGSANFVWRTLSAKRAGATPAQRPRVLCMHNFGSYFEYRGCIVSITSRWETWEPGISGTSERFAADSALAFVQADAQAMERLLGVARWDFAVLTREVGNYYASNTNLLADFAPVYVERGVLSDAGPDKDVVVYARTDRATRTPS